MSDLVPKLKQRNVAPEKLILDPNNPRLITKEADNYNESEALDRMVDTFTKMHDKKDSYKIKELENSIKQNGWWPVDYIFVKKFDDERYLVLEGNRRVTAILNLRRDDNIDSNLKHSLDKLSVMEIINHCPVEELKKKITYLLGVRHHGSLIKWTPFAQAYNIYKRYLELAEMKDENFNFESIIAQKVADALSIDFKDVVKRLKVYRAMKQLGEIDGIKNSDGGIKGRYYSVCEEVLLTSSKELKKYIQQDSNKFTLDETSISRMNNLCHFDKKNRKDAPINKPQEWRKLAKILQDSDKDKMLPEVEDEEEEPSIVFAKVEASRQKYQWENWLNKVNTVIKSVTLGDEFSSDSAKDVTIQLIELIEALETQEN